MRLTVEQLRALEWLDSAPCWRFVHACNKRRGTVDELVTMGLASRPRESSEFSDRRVITRLGRVELERAAAPAPGGKQEE
jgi:hypothetical protein